LGRMIRFVKAYNLPIYITENGIADPTDEKRARYLLSHLLEVAKELEQGTDIRGYFYWSLLDNFEWIKGFSPRFGLIEIDYLTMERKKRESAVVYQEVISSHQNGRHLHPKLEIIKQVFGSK
jgi:beta-glucosidase